MIGSVHAGSADHLQLGAGLFLKDFDFAAAQDAGQLAALVAAAVEDPAHVLGATTGNGAFSCVPVLRRLDANGLRTPCVGGVLCDGWQVTMSGTLLEVTPENLALLLAMGNVTRQGHVTTVTARMTLRPEDHLDSLCWVGDTARGLVLIELLGALNISGAVLSFRDQGEGSMPFTFQAHAPMGVQQDTAPFRAVFFEEEDQP